MSLFDNDNNLTLKQFIRKLWNDTRIILFYGIILFVIIFGLFSLIDIIGAM